MNGRHWRPWVVPLLLFYAVFFLFPQLVFLAVSALKYTGPGQIGHSVTVENYGAILHNAYFHRAIINTLELSALTAIASALFGLPLAYTIAHGGRRGKYLFALIIGVMFSSAVALALGWETLLAPTGGVNGLLLALGVVNNPLPLASNFTSIVIGSIHGAIPIATLGILPACEAVTVRQLEVSTGLGASNWRTFWSVILPQTYRSVCSIGLVIFAITTSIFTTPAILGGGRVALVSLAIYQQLLTLFDYPKSAALAAVLIIIMLLITVLARVFVRSSASQPGVVEP